MRQQVIHIIFILFLAIGCFLLNEPAQAASTKEGEVPEVSLEGVAPDQVDALLAKLSDEQVRSLLITELQKDAAAQLPADEEATGAVGEIGEWLHVMDSDREMEIVLQLRRAGRHARMMPTDLSWVMLQMGEDSTVSSARKNIIMVLLIIFGGFLVELLFRRVTRGLRQGFKEHAIPDMKGVLRFGVAVVHELPAIVHLFIFSCATILLFYATPLNSLPPVSYLFMALLIMVVLIRLLASLSRLVCSPDLSALRLLPVDDAGAARLHRNILIIVSYTVVCLAFLALIKEVGIQEESFVLLALVLGTVLLILVGTMIFFNRQGIQSYILAGDLDAESNWLVQQFAAFWHVLAIFYLFVVWLIFIHNELSGTEDIRGAFLLSLLVIPAYLVADSIGQWMVRNSVKNLRIYNTGPDSGLDDEELQEQRQKEQVMVARAGRIVRLVIFIIMGVWMLNLWGYDIPYATAITNAVFDSLVTITLALIFWRVAAGYIEQKIQEATPEEAENKEEDDEWGAAADRGRSYTLLPMVRKFIGTVLVVMVTLIVLSSIGVDIGPLLAGAGVIGLAIGFGAQKLVSDVLSGFFYLLDDAFRVGEYLQAGSVSGAVEAITLRNVMLRHHRGMLQIVPYSELGSITNFMRGGIVVKFNLEFPYDSDIDKIRKIIKKVGQAMLKDPEFGDDFIRPVKSQGVREITSSVMVIRVKFTAKPGTHFVIRREAYRRITEALAAKGIHYAHRKVIVELPHEEDEGGGEQSLSPEQKQKIAEAGAAAKAAIDAEEAKKADAGRNSGSSPAIPGM